MNTHLDGVYAKLPTELLHFGQHALVSGMNGFENYAHCQGILKGDYCWPPVWLDIPNQSNRRSTVQWYFPFSIPWHCQCYLLHDTSVSCYQCCRLCVICPIYIFMKPPNLLCRHNLPPQCLDKLRTLEFLWNWPQTGFHVVIIDS